MLPGVTGAIDWSEFISSSCISYLHYLCYCISEAMISV
uniref:Uncharacterized protein n=1 Tax=Arundo donax TaxID=35708 RepID=A0A0A9I0D1_ARUDO